MIEKIKELEKHALQLEPNNEDRLHWQRKVEQYAFKFIDDLPHTKTYIPTEDGGKDLLNHPFSDQPIKIEEALNILDKNVLIIKFEGQILIIFHFCCYSQSFIKRNWME